MSVGAKLARRLRAWVPGSNWGDLCQPRNGLPGSSSSEEMLLHSLGFELASRWWKQGPPVSQARGNGLELLCENKAFLVKMLFPLFSIQTWAYSTIKKRMGTNSIQSYKKHIYSLQISLFQELASRKCSLTFSCMDHWPESGYRAFVTQVRSWRSWRAML